MVAKIKAGDRFETDSKVGKLTREVIDVADGEVTYKTKAHSEYQTASVETFVKVLNEFSYEQVDEGNSEMNRESRESEENVESRENAKSTKNNRGSHRKYSQTSRFYDRSTKTSMDGKGPRSW